MPVQTKKGILLLSSGIDSPVAAHLMLSQGIKLIALHFQNQLQNQLQNKQENNKQEQNRQEHNLQEHNRQEQNRQDQKGPSPNNSPIQYPSVNACKNLLDRLERLHGTKIPFFIVGNYANEELISQNTNRRYQCLLCKRMMYRIAESKAREQGCDFIVTGESLGQVASQTLENLAVLDKAVSIPVLRPLLTYDKAKIIRIAEEIGTMALSIKADKCPFLPNSPHTRAAIGDITYEESKLDIIGMVERSLEGIKMIKPNLSTEAGFYNKVAKRFGSYKTPHTHNSIYPEGNPEEVFLLHLKRLGGKDSIAMDIGCADGRFTLSIAPIFQKIIAIDISEGMINLAKKLQAEQKAENVHFEHLDAEDTGYPTSSFDIIYSRRGPTPYGEIRRLLVPGGSFIGIRIGEQDCRKLQESFGRGQSYEEWHESRKEKEIAALEKLGFKILFAKDYLYAEYYPTYSDLETFLEGVPIFRDFDPQKDRTKLEAYAKAYSSEKGVLLERHRIVIVAQKI